ncbi:catechol 1,2-dioxygenase [Streptomyces sp. NPDC057486]|uniref:DODA-type extradiol aromatic ring-opening family dioxygenase n=1 Tax=Streptomyces sp. NPDC057486 TaxID=3346145 RepID=UPI0036756B95
MGEVVGAALLSHVATIMLPETTRRELNNGEDFSLVPGLHRLKAEVLDRIDYDTVLVFDSHWATTVEFVIAAHEHRSGLFTSDELPRGMRQVHYDYPGDPELAHMIAELADKHGTRGTAINDPLLPVHYPTINLLKYLQKDDESWVSIGVCQTAETEDYMRIGRAVGDAIAQLDRKVLLIASGAMSHRFWPLSVLHNYEAADPALIRTAEARAADEERIAWFEQGDHASVLRTMPEFREFKPEANFGHYLMMASAMGGESWEWRGRRFSAYENALGTGQIHMWFDPPTASS